MIRRVLSGVSIVSFCLLNSLYSAEIPPLITFIPSDTTNGLFGKYLLPMGDQNSDGYDDFMVGNLYGSAYLYYGGDPPDTLYELKFDSVQCSRMSNLGDLNGDGYDDLGMNGRGWYDWTYNIYYGGPSMDTIPDLQFGNISNRATGYACVTPDINFNGSEELFVGGDFNTTIHLYELGSGSKADPDVVFNAPTSLIVAGFAEGLVCGDFNGDDTVDIAAHLRIDPLDSTNGSIQFYFGGTVFDTIPDYSIRRSGVYQNSYNRALRDLRNLGDVNGDGFDDLYGGGGDSIDSLDFLYFCGSLLDTLPDVILHNRTTQSSWLGDINKDGYNDLIRSRSIEHFGANKAWVYYGGTAMDTSADIVIGRSDILHTSFIMASGVGGVGDVNGDGVDDFAISAKTASSQSVLYLYAGVDISTDVAIATDPTLPSSFELRQNYPNPFNPSTTIEFTLPKRAQTRIMIYNILGQQTVLLVDNILGAGTHRVIWDGYDSTGSRAPSGLYTATLTSGDIRSSVKMTLIK